MVSIFKKIKLGVILFSVLSIGASAAYAIVCDCDDYNRDDVYVCNGVILYGCLQKQYEQKSVCAKAVFDWAWYACNGNKQKAPDFTTYPGFHFTHSYASCCLYNARTGQFIAEGSIENLKKTKLGLGGGAHLVIKCFSADECVCFYTSNGTPSGTRSVCI